MFRAFYCFIYYYWIRSCQFIRLNWMRMLYIDTIQIQLSNMITQPKIQPQPNPTQQRIQKCQAITKTIQQKIQTEITAGQLKIRQKPLHIEPQDQPQPFFQNPQKSIRDKIVSLNQQLEMLQKHIANQKEEERSKEERKKKEAALLVERLKREKEDYRNKLRLNQMHYRLKNSALSEDVIQLMRERRMSLIQEKQKDMETRIYKNLNRRAEREDDQAKNEVSYWTKIKQIEDRKRHHSTKVLPSVHKMNDEPQFGVNLNLIDRKNSHKSIINLAHKRSFSKQELKPDYNEIVNRFLERAKAKQSESRSQNTPNLYDKSRLITNQAISQKNQSQLANSRIAAAKNEKIGKIMGSYIYNKQKLLGDQYLKQSLLRVDRSKSPRASRVQDNSMLQQSLQLKGNPAIFSRNDRLTNFQQRRQKILQNLARNKIQKSKAIEMLHPIQSMLDRIHPEGIEERLREKLRIFEQIQRREEKDKDQQSGEMRNGYEEDNEQVI